MTNAGKRLTRDKVLAMYPHLFDDVPAIEAEAVAAERARIRAAVETVRAPVLSRSETPMSASWNDALERVLAIINGADDE